MSWGQKRWHASASAGASAGLPRFHGRLQPSVLPQQLNSPCSGRGRTICYFSKARKRRNTRSEERGNPSQATAAGQNTTFTLVVAAQSDLRLQRIAKRRQEVLRFQSRTRRESIHMSKNILRILAVCAACSVAGAQAQTSSGSGSSGAAGSSGSSYQGTSGSQTDQRSQSGQSSQSSQSGQSQLGGQSGSSSSIYSSQSQQSSSGLSATGRAGQQQHIRASQIEGAKITSSSGQQLGTLSDVIINPMSGRVDFAIISVTGAGQRATGSAETDTTTSSGAGSSATQPSTTGQTDAQATSASQGSLASTTGSGKQVAVPWMLLRSGSGSSAGAASSSSTVGSTASSMGKMSFVFSGDTSKLQSAPSFSRTTDLSQPTWRQSVFSHYGLTSGAATGGAWSTPGGSTTGAGQGSSVDDPSSGASSGLGTSGSSSDSSLTRPGSSGTGGSGSSSGSSGSGTGSSSGGSSSGGTSGGGR